MGFIKLHMPDCGEAGVIVATRDDGRRVEFRGNPYHAWVEDEHTPMSRLHSMLRRINISQLHCNGVETLTPWHPEWCEVHALFELALQGDGHIASQQRTLRQKAPSPAGDSSNGLESACPLQVLPSEGKARGEAS